MFAPPDALAELPMLTPNVRLSKNDSPDLREQNPAPGANRIKRRNAQPFSVRRANRHLRSRRANQHLRSRRLSSSFHWTHSGKVIDGLAFFIPLTVDLGIILSVTLPRSADVIHKLAESLQITIMFWLTPTFN